MWEPKEHDTAAWICSAAGWRAWGQIYIYIKQYSLINNAMQQCMNVAPICPFFSIQYKWRWKEDCGGCDLDYYFHIFEDTTISCSNCSVLDVYISFLAPSSLMWHCSRKDRHHISLASVSCQVWCQLRLLDFHQKSVVQCRTSCLPTSFGLYFGFCFIFVDLFEEI